MINKNKGFTVVELIISIALLALILIPASKFFTDSFRVQARSQMRSSVTRVGQEVVEKLKNKQFGDLGLNNLDKSKIKVKFDEGKHLPIFTEETTNNYKEHETEINSGGVRYKVELQLDSKPILNDTVDVEIPEAFDHEVEINSFGEISTKYSILGGYSLDSKSTGNSFLNRGKSYTASIPTLILSDGDVDKTYGHTLLVKNGCENKVKIGIVKNFENPLKIYVADNKNIYFEDGALGDGRTAKMARFETVYIGNSDSYRTQNEGELLLKATLTVTDLRDITVKDIFEVTFPIDYDYSKN